jgi:hypothetical protein
MSDQNILEINKEDFVRAKGYLTKCRDHLDFYKDAWHTTENQAVGDWNDTMVRASSNYCSAMLFFNQAASELMADYQKLSGIYASSVHELYERMKVLDNSPKNKNGWRGDAIRSAYADMNNTAFQIKLLARENARRKQNKFSIR